MKPEFEVKEIFAKRGFTLAVAESCTGGLICSRLTDVPGSSEYFTAGVISYSNESKIRFLGVRRATIEKYGAVSAETAREMALGIRKRALADIGIAVTGIAGPSGGTKEKPVGLVYIALAHGKKVECNKFVFKGGRLRVKKLSADAALKMLMDV